MKIKKCLSFFLSMCIMTIPINLKTFTVNAEERTSILRGDVDGINGITPIDAQYIQAYLQGTISVTAQQLTAMDYNYDKVIDLYDAEKIMYDYSHGLSYTYSNITYNLIDNSTRTYYKHICNTGTSASHSDPYTINAVTTPIGSRTLDLPAIDTRAIDLADNENTNCVQIVGTDYYNGNSVAYMGSGFIISNNVIATAAHTLYKANVGFMKSVDVYIYNSDCSAILAQATAKSIHIPTEYFSNQSSNYDYGLIYIDNITYNDPNYTISGQAVNAGVMTDEFMYTGSEVTASGFTGDDTHGWRRYFSDGIIEDMDNDYPTEKPYRFHSLGYFNGGQSGGMVYFKPVSTFKSTVGIGTSSTVGGYQTFGMRITPTLLRFYYQNPNLS